MKRWDTSYHIDIIIIMTIAIHHRPFLSFLKCDQAIYISCVIFSLMSDIITALYQLSIWDSYKAKRSCILFIDMCL